MLEIEYAGEYGQKAGTLGVAHRHRWAQLEYVEEGRIALLAGGQRRALSVGEAVFLAPDVPHAWQAETRVGALTFKFLSDELPPLPDLHVLALDDPWLGALPRRAMTWWRQGGQARRGAASLLLALLHAMIEQAPLDEGVEWAALLDELSHGQGEMLSLDEMARRVHLSPSHFRRVFCEKWGEAPGRYQLRQRLERADGLLRYTRLSVGQIAEQAGYSDVSAFSKAFARHFGCRPTARRA